jgi:hypothetical protein
VKFARTNLHSAWVALVLATASWYSCAVQSISLPSIPADKVLVKSAAPKKVYINVSDDGRTWTEIGIDPNEESFVNVGRGISELDVVIRTGDRVWRGKTKAKRKYILDAVDGIYLLREEK